MRRHLDAHFRAHPTASKCRNAACVTCEVRTIVSGLQLPALLAPFKRRVLNFLQRLLTGTDGKSDYVRGGQYDFMHVFDALMLRLLPIDLRVKADAPPLVDACHFKTRFKFDAPHDLCPGNPRGTFTILQSQAAIHVQCDMSLEDAVKAAQACPVSNGPGACAKCNNSTQVTYKDHDGLAIRNSLIVCVMRYEEDSPLTAEVRRDEFKFGAEFNASPYMTAADIAALSGSGRMSLQAIAVHDGPSIELGHYWAYEKQSDGSWLKFDDKVVTKSTLKEVLNETRRVVMLRYDLIA